MEPMLPAPLSTTIPFLHYSLKKKKHFLPTFSGTTSIGYGKNKLLCTISRTVIKCGLSRKEGASQRLKPSK